MMGGGSFADVRVRIWLTEYSLEICGHHPEYCQCCAETVLPDVLQGSRAWIVKSFIAASLIEGVEALAGVSGAGRVLEDGEDALDAARVRSKLLRFEWCTTSAQRYSRPPCSRSRSAALVSTFPLNPVPAVIAAGLRRIV
jgi:hypothetical protein